MAEWLIVPLQAGCMNRVVEQRSMIHRICYQHPDPLTGKPKVSNLPVSEWATTRLATIRPEPSHPPRNLQESGVEEC